MDNCVCGHEEKSHILVSTFPTTAKRCTECNTCRGFVPSAVETALAKFIEEAHQKMFTPLLDYIEKKDKVLREKSRKSLLDQLDRSGLGTPMEIKKKEGKKFDGNKLRMDLVPTILVKAVAWILTFGAIKYDDRNWENGIKYNRLWGAMVRHLLSWYDGEKNDPQTGKPHLWHAACNLTFLMHFEEYPEKYKKFDDRPDYGEVMTKIRELSIKELEL